jgi:prepilin-type N-terminal cleavage/methylation domain-containing protein
MKLANGIQGAAVRAAHVRRAQAGFTLLEILTVLIIISILFAFVVGSVMQADDVVKGENTRAFISQVEATLSEYNIEFGDYPASTFSAEQEGIPNKTNMGAEVLIIKLCGKDWSSDVPEDRLGNSDDDASRQSLTVFSKPDLFELVDDWGNPIVYLHRRDYSKPQTYVTVDPNTGEVLDSEVKGYVNSKTGDPFNRRKYQLISAGPDGHFGSLDGEPSDDIANFKLE